MMMDFSSVRSAVIDDPMVPTSVDAMRTCNAAGDADGRLRGRKKGRQGRPDREGGGAPAVRSVAPGCAACRASCSCAQKKSPNANAINVREIKCQMTHARTALSLVCEMK